MQDPERLVMTEDGKETAVSTNTLVFNSNRFANHLLTILT